MPGLKVDIGRVGRERHVEIGSSREIGSITRDPAGRPSYPHFEPYRHSSSPFLRAQRARTGLKVDIDPRGSGASRGGWEHREEIAGRGHTRTLSPIGNR